MSVVSVVFRLVLCLCLRECALHKCGGERVKGLRGVSALLPWLMGGSFILYLVQWNLALHGVLAQQEAGSFNPSPPAGLHLAARADTAHSAPPSISLVLRAWGPQGLHSAPASANIWITRNTFRSIFSWVTQWHCADKLHYEAVDIWYCACVCVCVHICPGLSPFGVELATLTTNKGPHWLGLLKSSSSCTLNSRVLN